MIRSTDTVTPDIGLFDEIIRLKSTVPNDDLDQFEVFLGKVKEAFSELINVYA